MGCGSSVEAPASGGGDERPTPTPPGERPPVTEPTTQPCWRRRRWRHNRARWRHPPPLPRRRRRHAAMVRRQLVGGAARGDRRRAQGGAPAAAGRARAHLRGDQEDDDERRRQGLVAVDRLAAIHGGFPISPLSRSEAPEYCVHGRESFPNWHRPYLLDFERTMRRADKALGGDGNLGLPYWDWTDLTVNGEVMPGVVRKEILDGDSYEFPSDFFPVEPHRPMRFKDSRSDRAIRRCAQFGAQLARNSGAQFAANCHQSSDAHPPLLPGRSRAPTCRTTPRRVCTRRTTRTTRAGWSRGTNNVSLESPHNTMHGVVGGIMASYQSSFHPRVLAAPLQRRPHL